jgi:hypothetical protein
MRGFRSTILLVLLAGCLFPSLADLSGDAGSDAGDATSDVASNDATTDASDASDATALDAPVDTGPFCASLDAANVVICDDFDDTDASTFAKWTGGTGSLARDTDASVSPPFALLASTPALLDGATPNPQARVHRVFVQTVKHVTHTFDARIDQYDTLGQAVYMDMLIVTSGGIDVEYRLQATSTTLAYEAHIPSGQDAAVVSNTFALTPWTAGAWHHVVVDITTSAVPATLTVTIDGATVVGPNAAASVATFGTGQALEVQAGIYYASNPQTGWATHVDNVLVQAQ